MHATLNDPIDVMRITHKGGFIVTLESRLAFKLFTAEGEKLWAPGWSPEILGTLPQHAGLVFKTGSGDHATIWTVIESDTVLGRVRYSRVTPPSVAGIVEVAVVATEATSRVEVTYDLTALDEAGRQSLANHSSEQFKAMMETWQHLIEGAIANPSTNLEALVA